MAGTFLQLRSPFFLFHDLRMREYVCLVDHHSTFNSSCFPLQMKDLHSEWCQYTSNILHDLIAQGDEEALQVVAAAAEEGIAGTYSIRSRFDHQNVSQLKRSREREFVPFTHRVILLAILFNSLLSFFLGHDLGKLADFDLQKIPNVQTLGSDMVRADSTYYGKPI